MTHILISVPTINLCFQDWIKQIMNKYFIFHLDKVWLIGYDSYFVINILSLVYEKTVKISRASISSGFPCSRALPCFRYRVILWVIVYNFYIQVLWNNIQTLQKPLVVRKTRKWIPTIDVQFGDDSDDTIFCIYLF